jgi:hypothetical protein
MKEIWKDIKGYEGYYQVSNKGNVKRICKEVVSHGNKIKAKKDFILKANTNREGYNRVCLKKKFYFVHVLVAEAFLNYSKDGNLHVHHKNHNRADNTVENLEIMNETEHIRMHNSMWQSKKFDREIVKELYLQGYSTRAIAEKLNVGKTSIGDCIKEMGISRIRTQKIFYNQRNKKGGD